MNLREHKAGDKFRIGSILLFLCYSFFWVSSIGVSSAPADTDAPVATAPTQKPTRLQMPKSFDRETVRQLIADIDKPHNASILKIGYFLRRGQPELPVSKGYALLKTVTEAEPVGTKKWFLLQGLRGFAAFRVAGVDTAEGFTAYNAIFAHAASATHSNAEYPLRQAIGEFVSAVPGKFRDLDLMTDDRTRETLFKAWTAYAQALGATAQPRQNREVEPPWNAAIEAAKASDAFVPYVEKVLGDPTIPKSFSLLFAAATVLSPKNPDRAIALLEQAKPLLPEENGKPELNQAARFYNAFEVLLVSRNRLADAVSLQQEFVKSTGRGQANLLLLYHQSGNQAEVDRSLADLSEPTTNEQEINQAASGLFKLAYDAKAPDTKSGEQGAALLKAYLTAPRTRILEEEIDGRLALANFYLRQRKPDEAKAILTFTPPEQPGSPRMRATMRAIERMNEGLRATSQTPADTPIKNKGGKIN